MKQNHHYTFETKAVLYSGLLTFALLCILFAVGSLAPFGSKSLAVMDADIQYLDFFSYFKDVLSGKTRSAIRLEKLWAAPTLLFSAIT